MCDITPAGTPAQQLVVNGSFENPNTTIPVTWVRTGLALFSSVTPHCGKLAMNLQGTLGMPSSANQQISIPSGVSHAFLDFWVFFPSGDSAFLTVKLGATTIANLASSSLSAGKFTHVGLLDVDVSAFTGASTWLTFQGQSTVGQGPTIDDVSLTTAIHLLSNGC